MSVQILKYLRTSIHGVLFLLTLTISAQNYGENQLFADYTFEVDGTDAQGNYNLDLLTGATIVADAERGGNVAMTDGIGGILKGGGNPIPGGVTQMTFATWINYSTGQDRNYAAIMAFGSRSNLQGYNYFASRLPSSGVGFTQNGGALGAGSYKEIRSGSTDFITEGEWQHVAFTIDEDVIKIYLNGEELVSSTITVALGEFPVDSLILGSHLHTTNVNFQPEAKYDDTKIYHQVLTQNQIRELAGLESQFAVDISFTLNGSPLANGSIVLGGASYDLDDQGFVNLGQIFLGEYDYEAFNSSGDLVGFGSIEVTQDESFTIPLSVPIIDITVTIDATPLANGSIVLGNTTYDLDALGFVDVGLTLEGEYRYKAFNSDGVLIGNGVVEVTENESFTLALTSPVIDSNKVPVYTNADAWYTFDLIPDDERSGVSIDYVNPEYFVDDERGYVAKTDDDSYFTLDNNIAIDEDFSITFWYKWEEETLPPWANMMGINNLDNPRDQEMYLTPYHGFSSDFAFPTFSSLWTNEEADETNFQRVESGISITPNQWAHIAYVYSSGSVALYVNGQFAIGEDIFTTNEALGETLLSFGFNPLRPFRTSDASYDDLAIFDYALQEGEIQAIENTEEFINPDDEKFIVEMEDYANENWTIVTEDDNTYASFNSNVKGENIAARDAINYGLIDIPTGRSTRTVLNVWARVRSSESVDRIFDIRNGNDIEWRASRGLDIITSWEWVKIYTTSFTLGDPASLQFAPVSSAVEIDKMIITKDNDFDPETYIESDTQAPTTPNDLSKANETSTGLTLTWTASTDNEGVIAYEILNGKDVIGITQNSAINLTLPSSTAYDISVRALDAAGNRTSSTESVAFVTDQLSFTIDYADRHQTIDHFASSDGWGAEFIGSSWTESTRELFAKQLFSTEFDSDGNPEGIGLSSWRFNLGNGSIISGLNDWRTETEVFRDESGNYDFTKQAGSQWFLNRAKEYGLDHFVIWASSPPYYMTKNGLTYPSTSDLVYNLAPENYGLYADFLANVVEYFESEGTNIVAVSPLNEPQYDWSGGRQSGTPVTNEEIAAVVTSINNAFASKEVNAKILIPESGSHSYAHSDDELANRDNPASQQIMNFWNQSSPNYIGDLPYLAEYFAIHSYFNNNTLTRVVADREATRDALLSLNNSGREVEFWQTEYSILGTSYREAFNRTDDDMEEIDYSLWLATIIHSDLTFGNATGWSFWTTFSRVRFGINLNRFGLFNYFMEEEDVVRDGGAIERKDGWYSVSKNLWAYGQFSRFIRPGMIRMGVSRSDELSGESNLSRQMFSSYIDDETGEMAIVCINATTTGQFINLGFDNLSSKAEFSTFEVFETSATSNLKKVGEQELTEQIYLPPKSIITLSGNVSINTFQARAKFTVNERPFVGATVAFENENATTDAEGIIDFGTLQEDSYAFTLSKDTLTRMYTFDLESDTLLMYNIEFDSTVLYDVTGRFTINDDFPWVGATVSFQESTFTTLENGELSLGMLSEGSYSLSASQESTEIEDVDETFTFMVNSDTTIVFNIVYDSITLSVIDGIETIIYPNPSTEYLKVESAEDLHSVQLFDVLGRPVGDRKTSESNSFILDMASYPEGTYLLMIEPKPGVRKSIRVYKR